MVKENQRILACSYQHTSRDHHDIINQSTKQPIYQSINQSIKLPSRSPPTKHPPPVPQMAFSVYPANPSDIPALTTVGLAAFDDDPIVGYLARDVPPDVMYAHQCQQWRRRFDGSELTGMRVFKLVEGGTGWVAFFFFSWALCF